MADDEKGHPKAHTPPAPGVPDASAAVAPADQGAGEAADDADLLALVDGSPDILEASGLALAAENIASQRRGRGRPRGALNRRNTKLFDYLEALGHRDPAVTLSMWQTADTKELARQLGVGMSAKALLAVAALQVRAAAELLPYKYAKRPQQLELPDAASQRAVMVIGELNGSVNVVAGTDFLSAGVPPEKVKKTNEINGPSCDFSTNVAQCEQIIDLHKENDGKY